MSAHVDVRTPLGEWGATGSAPALLGRDTRLGLH